MKRIKTYTITILISVAFIFGSYLCALHGKCLHDVAAGSLLHFISGIVIILMNFIAVNLLIKSAHPDSGVLHRMAFSACVPLLIFLGTRLIVLKPFIWEYTIFSPDNLAFFFGIYLVGFSVSLLHFLIKGHK